MGAGSTSSIADDAPILDAYRSEDSVHLLVFCPHCMIWHRHGRCHGGCTELRRAGRRIDPCECPPGSGGGLLGAHCSCQRSPYRDTGYVLREVGPLTDEVKRAHGRPLGYSRSCRWDSCRLDRAAARWKRAGNGGGL